MTADDEDAGEAADACPLAVAVIERAYGRRETRGRARRSACISRMSMGGGSERNEGRMRTGDYAKTQCRRRLPPA